MKLNAGFLSGAWITILDDCNEHCGCCYRVGTRSSCRVMDLESVKGMIKTIAESGAWLVEFLGGEPTMHPHLVEFTKYAKELGLIVSVFTNGSLLDRALIKELQVDIYKVTVNSAFPDLHNKIVGAPNWVKTRQALDLLGEMGKLRTVMTVIGQENYDTAIDSLEKMLGWDVPGIGWNCAEPRLINGQVDGSQAIHPMKYGELITKAVLKFGINVPVKYAFEAPLCLLDRHTLALLQLVNKINVGCAMSGETGVIIDSDRSVLACQLNSRTVLDRFPDSASELRDKWNDHNEKLLSLMVKRSAKCERCSSWGECLGGCPMMWQYFRLEDVVQPK